MSSNKDIRWLHISDLHLGSPENKWLDSTLQDKFIEIIANLGRLDFILVSGDVIHQGQYNNHHLYSTAHRLFNKLSNVCENLVFAAGNHDYSRDSIRLGILKDWQKERNKREKEAEYTKKLASNFDEYVSFCKEIKPFSCFG